jgi:hypothetical protein
MESANLHAAKDRDRLNSIKWWNTYGSSTTHLHKLAMRVLSEVVNTSFAKRCWSTYNFIHIVKRNNLNVDQVESLVYMHYNLSLLSCYCEEAKNDRTYMTCDNNPKEPNLEAGAIILEHLEAKLLSYNDGDHIHAAKMPPPSTSRFPDAGTLPLASQLPTLHGAMWLVVMFHLLQLLQLLLFIDHRIRN